MKDHINNMYQQCVRCVMDTSDKDISFDGHFVCSHCQNFDTLLPTFLLSKAESDSRLQALVSEVRKNKGKSKYDSILGLSGGIDSSYVALLAAKYGLNPLVVHFDNGWNSEIAVSNIHKIVNKLGFDLYTSVIDWEEFRDIQRAFIEASVVDIEMVTDHAIFASMFNIARKYGIKYILSGTNFFTEHTMPKSWYWRKQDLANLKDIHAQYGQLKLKSYPMLGTLRFQAARKMGWGQRYIEMLNVIPYRREDALEALKHEFDWRYYGGKHYESVFTKFYQAYVLPEKFGIDKRRAHFSDLIHNGEMQRSVALELLANPPYDPSELASDRAYVLKKLGFSESEFNEIMHNAPVLHNKFKTDQQLFNALVWIRDKFNLGNR